MKTTSNTIKKIAAIAAVMTMALSTLGATVSAQETFAETSISCTNEAVRREKKTETDEEAVIQELANALDGTLWIGLDNTNTSYAMKFNGVKIKIIDNAGQSIKGYWAISADTLYIYSDKAMTKEIVSYTWDYDTEAEILSLDDSTYFYQSSASNMDEVKAEMERLTCMA